MTSSNDEHRAGDAPTPANAATLETSQDEQARGYLESLVHAGFIEELQSALAYARRLTNQRWRIVVTDDTVEITAHDQSDPPRITLPKPGER